MDSMLSFFIITRLPVQSHGSGIAGHVVLVNALSTAARRRGLDADQDHQCATQPVTQFTNDFRENFTALRIFARPLRCLRWPILL